MKGVDISAGATDEAVVLPDYGMPERHLLAFANAAQKSNGVLAVRNVNPYIKTLINEGCFSKPFGISIKTSVFGLTMGFLCKNMLFSGRGDINRYEDVNDHQKRLRNSEPYIRHHNFGEKALKLSRTRLLELTRAGKVNLCQRLSNRQEMHFEAVNCGEIVHFIATLNADKQYDISYLNDENQRHPVMVLATNEGQFITSDYDLLAVCPNYQNFQPAALDKTPFRTQSLVESQSQLFSSQLQFAPPPAEDEFGGNWSPRIQQTVSQLNQEISLQDDLRGKNSAQRVFHNAEFNNPFADSLMADIPCVVFFPKTIENSQLFNSLPQSLQDNWSGTQKFNLLYIESIAELKAIRDFTLAQGFYWPTHVKFKSMHPLGEKRYQQSVAAMTQVLKDKVLKLKINTDKPVQLPQISNPIQNRIPSKKIKKSRANSEHSTFFRQSQRKEKPCLNAQLSLPTIPGRKR